MSKFSILFPNFNLITFTFRSIFWPGGQALCRYILDGGREKFLAGKRVLDLGCGSGAACLAAIKPEPRNRFMPMILIRLDNLQS